MYGKTGVRSLWCDDQAMLWSKASHLLQVIVSSWSWNSSTRILLAFNRSRSDTVPTYMRNHSKSDTSILYAVARHVACESCFRIAYGIRHNRFASVKKKFLSGVFWLSMGWDVLVHRYDWSASLIHKVRDQLPMCDEITSMHLPLMM